MRWRRDDRPAPDDRHDHEEDTADNWLSEFRGQSVRPEALTAADRDAAGRQATQVGSRPRPGERAEPQSVREEHRSRPKDGQVREADRGTRQPRPDPPRADLERDVGPWTGVQRAPEPDPDGWDRRTARRRGLAGWSGPSDPGRNRDRRQDEDTDADRFGRLNRGGDRSAPDDRRRDWREPGPDTHGSQGHDGYRPGRWSERGRDDDRGRIPPGNDVDGPPWSQAPAPTAARPAEPAPRRELPPLRFDAGRPGPARQPQPGSQPPGDLRPDQHGRPAGLPGRGESRRDADGRSAPGPGPDEPLPPAYGPWQRRNHDPGGRPDAGSWLPRPDRAPRAGPARPSGRSLPPAAERALPPAAERALPPARPRPLEPELRPLPTPRPEIARPEHARPEIARPGPDRPGSLRSEPVQSSDADPVQSPSGARPELAANLSLADLDRVRHALELLSDEPDAAAGHTAARSDDPVPSPVAATAPGVLTTEGEGDEADTTPLPVILPGATPVAHPEPPEARGPFEPAHVVSPAGVAVAAAISTGAAATEDSAAPAEAEAAESTDDLPLEAAEKLDQIKDLLITAEAIGEANLDRHFDRVSQRQRELIREFFERALPGREPGA